MNTLENLQKQFRVIKWNASAGLLDEKHAKAAGLDTDHFYREGEIIQGKENTFSIDVMFAAPKTGFIVQYITRQILDKNTNQLVHDNKYWELFYIGKEEQINLDGTNYYLSYNPDAFKLGPEGKKLDNALFTQTGISRFYPYDATSDLVTYTKRGTMKYNAKLGALTGWNTTNFGKDKELGGGLPFSIVGPPIMTGLIPLDFQLRHIVRSSWNSNEVDGKPIDHQKLDEIFMYDMSDGTSIPFKLERHNVEELSETKLLQTGRKLQKYAIDNKLMKKGESLTPSLAEEIITHISDRHFTSGGSKQRKTKQRKTKQRKTKRRKT